jgi:outer membrane lipoprotein-sorting protein
MKLPAGPGALAPDAADALTDATAACRSVSSITAQIGVSGSVGGRRLRGNMLTGVAAGPPAAARLEALAPAGQPLFIFVATGDDATLLLPRDNRVLQHGRPAAVLEAVAGVPLDAVDLREALTGCTQPAAGPEGRQPGPDWRVVTVGRTDAYLRRNPQLARWQLVAAIHHGDGGEWRAEYANFEGGLPRVVHLVSADGRRFDLRLTLSQVELNATLAADVFRVQVPGDADPITLDELRRSGPLGTSAAPPRTPGRP